MNPNNHKFVQLALQNLNKTSIEVAVVTGSSGFVGKDLAEMLVARGCKKVLAIDKNEPPRNAWHGVDGSLEVPQEDCKIIWEICDITNQDDIENVFFQHLFNDEHHNPQDIVVIHLAAAVGPYYAHHVYEKVNFYGTLNLLSVMKRFGITKLVYSSSPSTRMNGEDLDGFCEEDLPRLPLQKYLHEYARTKALGELCAANYEGVHSVAVAPHTVYGPGDTLFLPNILTAIGQNRLRIFGDGKNKMCVSFVSNYSHGMICAGEQMLKDHEKIENKFYVVTDGVTQPYAGQCVRFWRFVDHFAIAMGFESLFLKIKLPAFFMYFVAMIMQVVHFFFQSFKPRFTTFNIKLLTMNRFFPCDNACHDLSYVPIVDHRTAVNITIEWFKQNWLPKFKDIQSKWSIVSFEKHHKN